MRLISTGERVELVDKVTIHAPGGQSERLVVLRRFKGREGSRSPMRAELLTVRQHKVTDGDKDDV